MLLPRSRQDLFHTHTHYTLLSFQTISPTLHLQSLIISVCVMAQNKPPTTSPPLYIHRNSNTISKTKPKVRIVHIFAPEIIKTDTSNFRELVQRLTGKPPPAKDQIRNPINSTKRSGDARTVISSTKKKKKIDTMMRERINGEEEIWRGANTGGGFLGGFEHDYFENGMLPEMNVVDDDDGDDHQYTFMEGATQIDDHVYGESQFA